MRISPAGILVVAAMSVPLVLELRTVFAFAGVDVPVTAVILLEGLILTALLALYGLVASSPTPN